MTIKKLNEMNSNESQVFAMVKSARIEKPIERRNIEKATRLSKRRIEQIIVCLRKDYGVPVYALKEYPHSGYFIARNEEERQAGLKAYRAQITTSQKNLSIGEALDLAKYWEAVA